VKSLSRRREREDDESSAAFENAAHDFPQHIAFRRAGATTTATISAIDGGRAMSWTLERR